MDETDKPLKEEELTRQCEELRAGLTIPKYDNIPWVTVAARTVNEFTKAMIKLENIRKEIPTLTKMQLGMAMESVTRKAMEIPLQLVPRLLEDLGEQAVCTKMEVINLLRTVSTQDPKAEIFNPGMYEGEAYNMVTYVMGESLAKEIQGEMKAGTKTRRNGKDIKQREKKVKTTALRKKAGGGGLRAAPTIPPRTPNKRP